MNELRSRVKWEKSSIYQKLLRSSHDTSSLLQKLDINNFESINIGSVAYQGYGVSQNNG